MGVARCVLCVSGEHPPGYHDPATYAEQDALIARLEQSGWRRVGGRAGLYARFGAPWDTRTAVVVPLDPFAPDYRELLIAALNSVALPVRSDPTTR